MKKNILIGILTICFMTSLGYGVIQQSEAENQRKRADEMEALAKKNETIAKEMQVRAEHQLRLAEVERARAEQALMVANEATKARKK